MDSSALGQGLMVDLHFEGSETLNPSAVLQRKLSADFGCCCQILITEFKHILHCMRR